MNTETSSNKAKQKQENPFISIIVNVVLPYYVLTKAAPYLGEKGPTWALIIALIFPIIYGLHDYISNSRTNYVSIFGVLNTVFTGGFALMSLNGIWFIVKEAAFPFVLGLFVLYTSFTEKPFIKFMFNFTHAMNAKLVEQKLVEHNNKSNFDKLIKKSNTLFSFSFFLSSLLNFLLASWIFKDIDQSLPENQVAELLNQQIAEMTWMGYVVIALPLMIFVMLIMMKFINGLKSLTQLELEDIFPAMKS